MPKSLSPIRLTPLFRERIWGRKSLVPFFSEIPRPADTGLIGEAWFTFEENLTSCGIALRELLRRRPELLGSAADPKHPDVCPLLVKLIFTTEKLSVQVHPDDAYAELHHNTLGKTEAWYVIAAKPESEVALGFREPLSRERLKQSALSGQIERLLAWHKVKAGDIVFVPAGTVHAIGAGLTICEVQENSDITYRLYDYGRPRELHLEHGAAVSKLEPSSFHSIVHAIALGRDELAVSKYFRIERLRPRESMTFNASLPYYLVLVCLKGEGTIAGSPFTPGEAWFVPAGAQEFAIQGAASEWILTYTADEPTPNLQVR